MSINWQDVIETVGVTTGSGAVFLASAGWLIKKVLEDRLARDADVFKTRLKADADVEIERLRSSLQMVAAEHQIRFSNLHEKRAEIIAEVYRRLVLVYWDGRMFLLTSLTPQQADEFSKTDNEARELFAYVDQHRIYLPQSICESLDRFIHKMQGHIFSAGLGALKYPNGPTPAERVKAFREAYQEFEAEIPSARKALEDEFRKILGATDAAIKAAW